MLRGLTLFLQNMRQRSVLVRQRLRCFAGFLNHCRYPSEQQRQYVARRYPHEINQAVERVAHSPVLCRPVHRLLQLVHRFPSKVKVGAGDTAAKSGAVALRPCSEGTQTAHVSWWSQSQVIA